MYALGKRLVGLVELVDFGPTDWVVSEILEDYCVEPVMSEMDALYWKTI
jgi:hypothetical protein